MFANFWKRVIISLDSEITAFLAAVDLPAGFEAIPKPSLIDVFVICLVPLEILNVLLLVSEFKLDSLAVPALSTDSTTRHFVHL